MAEDQTHTVERTLVLLKPDALARGLAGRIITRFEDTALKIVGTKMKWMDAEFTRRHYFDLEERLGSEVYNVTSTFMQQGPVIALVLEGFDAIATVRKIVGSTYPNQAPAGTVRGDLSHYSSAASVARARPSRTSCTPPAMRRRRSRRWSCGSTRTNCRTTRRLPRSTPTDSGSRRH